MQTLLIDNYDSYTFNLFQLIAEVNGVEPVVWRNDDPAGADLRWAGFDNIVISPGPGHPGRDRDFGVCGRVLAEASVPILGVCLGHQGIAVAEGGVVAPAPEPRHGHVTRVRHNDDPLFDGLPQGFTAVRYHSLHVPEPLPETLVATAWAEDGVLMGIRHRNRPVWGVQFHPESVLTEHGHRLLANFRDQTAATMHTSRHQAARPDRPARDSGTARDSATTRPASPTKTTGSAVGLRLHTRVLTRPVDAEAAFSSLFTDSPRAFWLDSSRSDPDTARFSYFGDDSGPLAEFVRYDVSAGAVQVDRAGQPSSLVAGTIFDYLRRELARRRVTATDLPFAFTGGYVGYFGYETKADCGAARRHQAPTPDSCWIFADRIVAVDHRDGTGYLVCLAEDSSAGHAAATRWLDRMTADLAAVPLPAPATPVTAEAGAEAGVEAERWLVQDRSRYLASIEACQRALRSGESYEICLTNAAWLPAPADSLDYHRLLRRYNPAPYAAYLRFGDVDVASSSPERFLRISPDGTVEAKPIKGTARRGRTAREDEQLRRALVTDPKSRAENLMIVDLLRNDLGRVCTVGTIEVPRLMATETYQTVHQLVSTVRGRLRPGTDPLDCVQACFPGGSMTGAPKLRTLEIIDELETEARGVYSGALGYLSCDGAVDLSIVIRTAVFAGGRIRFGAGGAIVLGSDPDAEYAEMLLKLAAPLRAYRAYLAGSTLAAALVAAGHGPAATR